MVKLTPLRLHGCCRGIGMIAQQTPGIEIHWTWCFRPWLHKGFRWYQNIWVGTQTIYKAADCHTLTRKTNAKLKQLQNGTKMGPLHGFTSHFKPQFSIFFRHPSPMSPTLSGLPDIAPKAQRPLSRRAPGAIGTPVLVESCFNRRFLWKSAGSWWNGLNTPEIYRWTLKSWVCKCDSFILFLCCDGDCPPLPLWLLTRN